VEDWGWRVSEEARADRHPFEGGLAGEGRALRYGLMRRFAGESRNGKSANGPGPLPLTLSLGERVAEGRVRAAESAQQFQVSQFDLRNPNFEDFLELFARAFRLEKRKSKMETRPGPSPLALSLEERVAGEAVPPVGRMRTSDSTADSPLPSPEVVAAAKLVWERLAVYRRQAEQEAESLKQILETAVAGAHREPLTPDPLPRGEGGRGSSASGRPGEGVGRQGRASALPPETPVTIPQPLGAEGAEGDGQPAHALAEKIVRLFGNHWVALDAAFDLQEKLRAAFYTLLTKRHGAGPRFKGFEPMPLDEEEKEWEEWERQREEYKREREESERQNAWFWEMLRAAEAGEEEFEAWKEKYRRCRDLAVERMRKRQAVGSKQT
jgi:hypothetical protein